MPFPSAAELEECYSGDYAYPAHEIIETEKRWRSDGLLDLAGVRGGRVLDVGCMYGYLLDEAKCRGAETWGVEIAEAPAAAAASHGHRIAAKTVEELRAQRPDLRFDYIFAQHVLEHIADPASFLSSIHSLLTENGRLVLAVPNINARLRSLATRSWGWYQVPVHVYHYGKTSLTQLVERYGFSVKDVQTRGGDTLFMALTAFQSVGIVPKQKGGSQGRPSWLLRTGFRALGQVTKPIVARLDDELIVVAERSTKDA